MRVATKPNQEPSSTPQPPSPDSDAAEGRRAHRQRLLLWFGVGFAALCGALWGLVPMPDAKARLEQVPLQAGGMAGADVPLTDMEKKVFARVNILHRLYQVDGRAFYLTMIDGTRDRHVVHDPRYCFQGGGWAVQQEQKLPLPGGGEATWLRTSQNGQQAQALFWFDDARSRHSSLPRFWWQTTLRRVTLGHSAPEPVLVVLQSFGPDQPHWPDSVKEVIATLGL
jgi:hypothetical protein